MTHIAQYLTNLRQPDNRFWLSNSIQEEKYSDGPQLCIPWNKLYKTLEYWYRDMLKFDFLEKGLGIVSPSHFLYDF